MTDAIGWGDVDVTPPRRRPRAARWGAAAVAVVVVAGVAAAPTLRRHLGDDAATWLAAQWSTARAIDDARSTIAFDVGARTGLADGAIADDASRALDIEAAARLAALEHHVAGRRTWTSDVAAAARAVRAALTALTADLRRQARGAHPASDRYLIDTERLATRATSTVTALLARHHLHQPRVATPRSHAADADLALLARPTNQPTGLRLAVQADGAPLSIVDLDTGHRVNYSGDTLATGVDGAVVSATRLLARHGQSWLLLGGDGASQTRLPPAIAYLPAGADAWWQLTGANTARKLDDAGRPITRLYSAPAGFAIIPGEALRDDLAITAMGFGTSLTELWNPVTGARRPAWSTCSLGMSNTTVVWGSCNGRTVDVYDANSGVRRAFPVPAPRIVYPETPPLPSDDGKQVAVALATPDQIAHATVFDVASGAFRPVPSGAGLAPASWSPDGRWLLLTASPPATGTTLPGLMLFRPADGTLLSVRLPGVDTSASFALVP